MYTETRTTIGSEARETRLVRPRIRPRRRLWRDALEILILVLLTYTPINLMTARAVVEGPSMEPTFYTGQLVIVNRSAYFFAEPERGDVIVLHNPRDLERDDLIKRVVGLPGEIVDIQEGRVYVNGTLLEEPYVARFCNIVCNGNWELGPDEYFILGDNRPNSYDSHNFGPINRKLIVGKAWIRYWPINDFRIINHPDYGQINEEWVPLPPTSTPTPSPTPTPGPSPTPWPTMSPDNPWEHYR